MTFFNFDLMFYFDLPDYYEEISKSDYKEYGFDKSTLNVFITSRKHKPFNSISINRDDEAKDEKEFEELVDLNIQNMTEIGFENFRLATYKNTNGRVDVLYSSFKTLKYVTYFTCVNGTVIASSAEIKEENDPNEKDLKGLFDSIRAFTI